MGSLRREQILDFITEFVAAHGYGPTLREIAAASGLRSVSAVVHHLYWLETLGRLHRDKGTARGISLTKPPSE